MGASLTYEAEAAVSDAVRSAIAAEISALQHEWWAEPICFINDPDRTGRLYGDTKLFLLSYAAPDGTYEEIGPEDDSLMAWRDASFIVRCLERWSGSYALQWRLSCAGEHVGTISGGAVGESVERFLRTFLDIAQVLPDQASERADALLVRYSGR